MDVTVCPNPVRHFVVDGFVEPRAWWEVPPADSPTWEARYDNPLECGKRTTRAVHGWSEEVVRAMHGADVVQACARAFGFVAFPDETLWAGGLQVIASGGRLSTHLDGCLHSHRPFMRRAIQLVCFCNYKWGPGWDGRFYFADANGEAVTWIDPVPGRLLAFEASDLAYHGVERVCETAPERVTVASSLLAPAREYDTRRRALFLPQRS